MSLNHPQEIAFLSDTCLCKAILVCCCYVLPCSLDSASIPHTCASGLFLSGWKLHTMKMVSQSERFTAGDSGSATWQSSCSTQDNGVANRLKLHVMSAQWENVNMCEDDPVYSEI
jgi:hypothetical protein